MQRTCKGAEKAIAYEVRLLPVIADGHQTREQSGE